MASLGTLPLTGASGRTYDFEIYALDANLNAVGAVYAFTSRKEEDDGAYTHAVIYIGETGDLSMRFNGHHKEECFVKYTANRKCIHRDDGEDSRRAKEEDLIANYYPPCND